MYGSNKQALDTERADTRFVSFGHFKGSSEVNICMCCKMLTDDQTGRTLGARKRICSG